MAARQQQLLLAVALALLSCGLTAAAAGAGQAERPEKLVEVDAYALVQVPGCNVGKPNSLVLPPGGFPQVLPAAASVTPTPRLAPRHPCNANSMS
jgi:hypothetical protein